MSSAINHRRRSRRSYEKRVSTMNTLQRKTVIKERQRGFLDMLKQRRQNRKREKAPIIAEKTKEK